jgi:hypothetical protein
LQFKNEDALLGTLSPTRTKSPTVGGSPVGGLTAARSIDALDLGTMIAHEESPGEEAFSTMVLKDSSSMQTAVVLPTSPESRRTLVIDRQRKGATPLTPGNSPVAAVDNPMQLISNLKRKVELLERRLAKLEGNEERLVLPGQKKITEYFRPKECKDE